MVYKAKENFLWYMQGDIVPDEEIEKHPNWKQHVTGGHSKPGEKLPDLMFDMNKDGKVDKKDISLMAKGLRSIGSKRKSRVKKGKK